MAQNIRVQKTFEALFALEDIREIFRGTLPTGLSETKEQEFQKKVSDLKEIINELESGKGNPKVMRLAGNLPIRDREESFINIQPIQAAGRLTVEARKALMCLRGRLFYLRFMQEAFQA